VVSVTFQMWCGEWVIYIIMIYDESTLLIFSMMFNGLILHKFMFLLSFLYFCS
jgi:hypothetical protein